MIYNKNSSLINSCEHVNLCIDHHGSNSGYAYETLVDAGAEVARALKGELTDRELLADRPCGEATLYASDRPEDFGALAGQFLRRPLESAVQHVDIERY